MTEDEILSRCPDLIKVTPEAMSKILDEKYGIQLELHKTWGEMGLDDMDCLEVIMELEKRLNIVIPDELGQFMEWDQKPPHFIPHIRHKKLEQLGI